MNTKDLYNKISIFRNNRKKLINKISYAKRTLDRFDYDFNLKEYKKYIEKFVI